MNFSSLFILRPVATSLIMVIILFLGILGYKLLPVSSLPEVEYPYIQISTIYPGANPQVMSSSVTAPLEKQLGQMPGLKQMNSSSGNGCSFITLEFDQAMRIDTAEQQVQSAINAASNFLPTDLPNSPIYYKINPADTPILSIALTSENLPLNKIQDLTENLLIQKLSQVSGVGLVKILGGQKPAIRVQINSNLIASLSISLEQVKNAILASNVNGAKGYFDNKNISYSINANDLLSSADEYKKLIVAYNNNQLVRLEDIALVLDDIENSEQAAWVNNDPAIILNIYRQPGTNIIKISDTIKLLLPKLSEILPESVKLKVISDRTSVIQASINHVHVDLLLAIILVTIVIFIILHSLSATIIASITIPISLVGSLAVIYLMGFSINNLTLMALIIASGFVVDDAIVMIENISRYIEEGINPLDAALKGASQIFSTIISLTISLTAVLIPLLFMDDIIGRLFREFALTLMISIFISAFISLSFTPMLCAKILHIKIYHSRVRSFSLKISDYYAKYLQQAISNPKPVIIGSMLIFLATIAFFCFIPKGFLPNQESNLIRGIIVADQNSSFNAMAVKQQDIVKMILEENAIENVSSFIGIDSSNSSINNGSMLIKIKDNFKASKVVLNLQRKLSNIAATRVFLNQVEDITIDGNISQGKYRFALFAQDKNELSIWTNKLLNELKVNNIFKNISIDQQDKAMQVFLKIDRDRAAQLGVNAAKIDDTLYNIFAQRQITTMYKQNSQYKVILEGKPEITQGIEAFDNVYLSSQNSASLPLNSIVSINQENADLVIKRQDKFPVINITFDISEKGYLSDAIEQFNQIYSKLKLPNSITGEFQGIAKVFKQSLKNEVWLILAAIFVIYIVLGILYESFIHPLTILTTIPSACFGALFSLWITGKGLDVIGIIGLILLIGIVKKNAIMMIDFALEQQRFFDKTPREAIFAACMLRFRPIMMTTIAAMLGSIPLMITFGYGAELRQPLGISIFGGLLVSQVVTLFSTPIIYLFFEKEYK